ncbi:glutamate synthase subunit alpha, partial [Aduncisulcus paluster]
SVGQNFAAGMTGGCAYILDLENTLADNLNPDHVELIEVLEGKDFADITDLLEKHSHHTSSAWAATLLSGFEKYKNFFRKVQPKSLG